MIGNFYSFLVAVAVNAVNFVGTPVNIRSTSVATEVANGIEWTIANT